MLLPRPIAAACAAGLLVATAACSLTESNDTQRTSAGGPVTVTSSDDACELSSSSAPSGRIVFRVANSGEKVTEFYLYDEDGTRIVAEVENVGPGLRRDLVLAAAPGHYVAACKPGMTGQGIRSDFTVTDSGREVAVPGVDQADVDAATADYQRYVGRESAALLGGTEDFVAAYTAGRDDEARRLYAPTRAHWERIEPVAESFGDLDPKMDLREADLQQGQPWTGWHRIEKDLWPPAGTGSLRIAQRRTYAEDLLANTRSLDARVAGLELTLDQIGNGAKGLLDEVAATKITGEEEVFSHTDLWDIRANVDGARAGFEAVEDLLRAKDPSLHEQIEDRFAAIDTVLARHRSGDGFVSYDRVTEPQRKQLSDAVNSLAEPLSRMTGALTR